MYCKINNISHNQVELIQDIWILSRHEIASPCSADAVYVVEKADARACDSEIYLLSATCNDHQYFGRSPTEAKLYKQKVSII